MTTDKNSHLILLAPPTSVLKRAIKLQKENFLVINGVWNCEMKHSEGKLCEENNIPILPNDVQVMKQVVREENYNFLIVNGNLDEVWTLVRELKKEHMTVLDSSSFWIMEELLIKEAQLSYSNSIYQELETILTYAQEGIQLVDKEGIVRYINPAFTTITGISAIERIGKSIFEVSPNGSLAEALQSQKPVLGWKNKVKDSSVEVISNAAPIYVDGEMTGAVVTFQDVTQIMKLLQQLHEQTQQINQLHEHLKNIYSTTFSFQDIIGESNAIQQAVVLAEKAATTDSTVLLTGESGTGKELFAHAIHQESPRNSQPFIVINCAAIPEALLESELFGHEKGAFTSAIQAKPGKIEIANGGTLFLDEIGDMSPYLQAKLLRVLQSKQIERVGGLRPQYVDVRIIAATNRNLIQLIKEGVFREDLYYRLNIVRIEVPPLRKRMEDIPSLVDTLIKKIGRRLGLKVSISNKAAAMLTDYHWPGNVRELEGFLERIINENGTGPIADSLVIKHVRQLSYVKGLTKLATSSLPKESEIVPLRVVERSTIEKAMRRFGTTVDGKKRAARSLGISLATLYNKIKDYELLKE